jgi:hypothetical protein
MSVQRENVECVPCGRAGRGVGASVSDAAVRSIVPDMQPSATATGKRRESDRNKKVRKVGWSSVIGPDMQTTTTPPRKRGTNGKEKKVGSSRAADPIVTGEMSLQAKQIRLALLVEAGWNANRVSPGLLGGEAFTAEGEGRPDPARRPSPGTVRSPRNVGEVRCAVVKT